MEPHALRRMVAATIVLLLIYQVGTGMATFFGGVSGGLAAVVVAIVSLVGVRLAGAGAGSIAWFLVPSLAFALVPLAAKLWHALSVEQATWIDRVVAIAPLLVGFVIPIVLLLIVYIGLRTKTFDH